MKTLYLIGGAMGVGKTSVGREMKKSLYRSVWLDGDWCWNANPFWVTEETKAMVMDNISHVLNNFLRCTAYDDVIFTWVMDEQPILDELLSRLDTAGYQVRSISLMCTPEALRERLARDVRAGIRQAEVIPRGVERLGKYAGLNTEKLDVSALTPLETARRIAGDDWPVQKREER